MDRAWKSVARGVVAAGLIGGCFFAALAARPQPTPTGSASSDAPEGTARSSSSSAGYASGAQSGPPKPRVGRAVKFDVSPPLRSIPPILTPTPRETDDERGEVGPVNNTSHDPDPVVQRSAGSGVFGPDLTPPADANFEGISNPTACGGCAPPDPNGDIGPNHYVQMVNLKFQIFSRTGTSLYGPANTNTIWTGFGGLCEIENAGDPIVLYDQLADRWLLTQFTAMGPLYFNCVAVSTTSDPTGSYYRYAFSTGANFPDYPKYGVWPDAYYISTREFAGGAGPFAGVGAYALNRAQMLVGNPAAQVVSFLFPPAPDAYRVGDGLLPSDLEGTTFPPAGSPNYFVGSMDNGAPTAAPADALNIFKFHVDFATPSNSTFTFTNQVNTAPFDSIFPCTPTARQCIPQPGTTVKVDILSYRQRPLHRLSYRNFGTHESLVTNQSVEAAAGVAGIRWWELRSPNSSPTIFQEGTYAPADGVHRWMGSIATDASGNMGLGYSVSNGTTVSPGIRYTGRLVGDPLGTMPQGEAVLINGGGSQTAAGNRWGDYTAIAVDPLDDCTFWYTNEYYGATSANSWQTRIGSFKFPECVPPPPRPVVGITKVPDALQVSAGSQIGFTVTINNIGGATATGLTFSDNLPAGTAINWSIDGANTDPGWSVSGSPPNESLVYTPTTLAGNTSTKAHVVSASTSASCGSYTNIANFTTGNDGSGQALATAAVGLPNVTFSQNFDGVTVPTLPAGWTATNIPPTATPLWATSNSGNPAPSADTAPNAVFVDNPAVNTDKSLDSPSIPITTNAAKLTFRHNYNLEGGFDGGVLEISIGGGPFADILTAGGSFVAGGYSGTIAAGPSSLAGRAAWTGTSSGFVTTTVNLPALAMGQNIRLRWRMASDNTIGAQGWRVDTVTLSDGLNCNPTAVSVASITAQRVPAGVLLRWRTTTAARLLGFDVFGQTGAGRTKLNRSLIAAKESAHTYSYLVKRRASGYWIRTVRLDGSRVWYGPVRAR